MRYFWLIERKPLLALDFSKKSTATEDAVKAHSLNFRLKLAWVAKPKAARIVGRLLLPSSTSGWKTRLQVTGAQSATLVRPNLVQISVSSRLYFQSTQRHSHFMN